MNTLLLAEEIVRNSNREHPADAVLRQKLRVRRGITRAEGAEVSHLVFSYYRWKEWLNAKDSLPYQIKTAGIIAKRYRTDPLTMSDEVLLERAVPQWLAKVVEVSSGLVRAFQAEPRIWIRARGGLGPDIARELGDCRLFGKGPLADIIEYCGDDDLFRSAGFQAGDFEMQDISSAAVGFVCAPAPGETWWDACAGEGGKMMHLSDLMGNRGLIWATDRAEWRLKKLRMRAARGKVFNYRSAGWDGGERLPFKTRFDGVLVDAPCSGVGTWHRNPHARWTTTEQDVTELAGVQRQLLRHAAKAVKAGGKLVYAACTLTRAETAEVTRSFSEEHPDFVLEPFAHPLRPGGSRTAALQLTPQDFGGNGFYIAAWRRKAV